MKSKTRGCTTFCAFFSVGFKNIGTSGADNVQGNQQELELTTEAYRSMQM